MKSLVSSISLSITAVLLFFATNSNAQVGIGTSIPQAAMDITSTNAGLLLPRIALTSATVAAPVTNPSGGAVVPGTMVWNTGTAGLTPAGYYYWENSRWNLVASNSQPQVYFGKLIISATGTVTVTGVPFTPTSVEFTAMNRVMSFNAGAYRSGQNNSNDIRMAGGHMTGFAQNVGGTIGQQVIAGTYSGSSLNNIGTFASDTHCIAAFFVNNNGEPIRDDGSATGGTVVQQGLIRASLTSFNSTGFVLNVDRALNPTGAGLSNPIVIIFKAYR
jgi:hypothetical protein